MKGLHCLGDYSAKWIIHRNTYIPTGVNITPDFVPQVGTSQNLFCPIICQACWSINAIKIRNTNVIHNFLSDPKFVVDFISATYRAETLTRESLQCAEHWPNLADMGQNR